MTKYIISIVLSILSIIFSFAQTKILVSISNEEENCSLYQYDLNGNREKEIFNFGSQPLEKTGIITNLSQSADATSIYFVSDNAYLYTLARRNIFKIPNNGSWLKQLTPGPNSGQILPNLPTGTVKGRITDGNGNPYGSAVVLMEGFPLQNTDANGNFIFNNVPQGLRWVTGYRTGSLVYKSLPVNVAAGITTEVALIPESDYKMRYELPKEYNNHIYYKEDDLGIYRLDLDGQNRTKIFSTVGLCGIGGYDIAEQDGQILISDYCSGTSEQRGIYTCDKNGNNLKLFLDFKQDNNWDDACEVFWSPDKSKIAIKASYNYYIYFVVLDLNGNILGTVYFSNNYTKYNIDLYGWNPDGNKLLYSTWLDKPLYTTLASIEVNSDGSIDPSTNKFLLQNVNLRGACWADLSKPNAVKEHQNTSETANFKLFPNPNTGEFSIDILKNSEIKSIQITDIKSNSIHFKKQKDKLLKFKINPVKSGIYLLDVIFKNGTRAIKKIIVE